MVIVKLFTVSIIDWLRLLRFIADGMLGKIVRWLRMLGHDVHYYRDFEDELLLKMAKSEERFLLTRDRGLYQQAKAKTVEVVLIEAEDEAGKLADLSHRFGLKLEIDLTTSRCPKCNEMIKAVSKEDVVHQIPESTAEYIDEFWRCPRCYQVYWQGAHWKKIEKTLKEAKKRLELQ